MKIEHIGVSSAAFVVGGVLAVLWAILGIIKGVMLMFNLQLDVGFTLGLGLGDVDILAYFIVYALAGFIIGMIAGAISAVAYNKTVKLFGGLEISLKE